MKQKTSGLHVGKYRKQPDFKTNLAVMVLPAALLVGVEAKELTVLLNEHGGIFDFSYEIDIERSACGTNRYHVEIREA